MLPMQKRSSPEKRKYPRFNVNLPVKYSRTSFSDRYGRVVNASEGGLMVYLPEEVGKGERLTLKLFFPSLSEEVGILEAPVQVVWKDVKLRNDWAWDYRTGVKFVHFSQEDKSKFASFLTNLTRDPSCSS